jgi:hypothetical protein
MKYETPKLTALMPAISAVQSIRKPTKEHVDTEDSLVFCLLIASYNDWE